MIHPSDVSTALPQPQQDITIILDTKLARKKKGNRKREPARSSVWRVQGNFLVTPSPSMRPSMAFVSRSFGWCSLGSRMMNLLSRGRLTKNTIKRVSQINSRFHLLDQGPINWKAKDKREIIVCFVIGYHQERKLKLLFVQNGKLGMFSSYLYCSSWKNKTFKK